MRQARKKAEEIYQEVLRQINFGTSREQTIRYIALKLELLVEETNKKEGDEGCPEQ
jgi:hypothetical protein